MPSNLVHNKKEEAAWTRAKAAVRKQYPDIHEGNPRFYKLTTTIFQNMKALQEDPNADAIENIDQDDDAELHRTGHVHKALVGLILRSRGPRFSVGLVRGRV